MTPSYRRYFPYWLLAASIVLSAVAQLFMKVGMTDIALLWPQGFASIYTSSRGLAALAWVGSGLLCYGLSLCLWLVILAELELSLAYPLLSLSYVLVYLGALLWPRIGEHFSLLRLAGIAMIVLGVSLVSQQPRSDHRQHD